MTRRSKNGERALARQVAAAKKKSRELLKKQNKDIRVVRHEVSTLKKSGIVSKRIKAGSYFPSKYMLKKIEKNRDILEGKAYAVRASKLVRKKYEHKFESRGGSLIVPQEFKEQRTRITRGLVEVSRELKNGQEVRIILPYKPT